MKYYFKRLRLLHTTLTSCASCLWRAERPRLVMFGMSCCSPTYCLLCDISLRGKVLQTTWLFSKLYQELNQCDGGFWKRHILSSCWNCLSTRRRVNNYQEALNYLFPLNSCEVWSHFSKQKDSGSIPYCSVTLILTVEMNPNITGIAATMTKRITIDWIGSVVWI